MLLSDYGQSLQVSTTRLGNFQPQELLTIHIGLGSLHSLAAFSMTQHVSIEN